MTWLLVEDDPDIRTVVAVMMQLWGETALALSDGNAAWKWLDSVDAGTASDLPELALMDIRMPGHTGDQIAARIRQTAKIRNIPIILMTAFSLTDAEVAAMKEKAGIDHLIKKPLPDMDDFKSTLYRVRDEKQKAIAAAPAPTPPPAVLVAPPPPPAIEAIAPVSVAAPASEAPAVPTSPTPQPVSTTPATPAPNGQSAPAVSDTTPTEPTSPAPLVSTTAPAALVPAAQPVPPAAPTTATVTPTPAPVTPTPQPAASVPNRDTKPLG